MERKSWLSDFYFRPWDCALIISIGIFLIFTQNLLEENLSGTVSLGAQFAGVRRSPVREHVLRGGENLHAPGVLLAFQLLHHSIHCHGDENKFRKNDNVNIIFLNILVNSVHLPLPNCISSLDIFPLLLVWPWRPWEEGISRALETNKTKTAERFSLQMIFTAGSHQYSCWD